MVTAASRAGGTELAPPPSTSGPDRLVHLVSLGCPKNRVDSEVMLGGLLEAGWRPTDDAGAAHLIVVNTCGFLQEALAESVDTVLELAVHKDEGACERLVMTGCAVERHADELARELPEVDHLLGVASFHRLASLLDDGGPRLDAPAGGAFLYDHRTPRARSQPAHSAYVKVAEGCDNRCTFCTIPTLRGPQRSRPLADVVAEVETLATHGVREVNLVAQDLTAYGYDLGRSERLHRLLRALGGVKELRWIRLLYAYPRRFPELLLRAVAEEDKVCRYVDLPLQHIADRVLRRMKRGHRAERARRLLDRIRERVPGVALRTAFIVGFPGERDEDFEELVRFVEAQRFDHVGVFRYSPEPGTPAADLSEPVPTRVARQRYRRLMAVQRRISRRRLAALVGTEVEVLMEGRSPETDLLLQGRTEHQAPEVDGVVLVNDGVASAGDLVRVRIEEAHDYDLVGGIVPD